MNSSKIQIHNTNFVNTNKKWDIKVIKKLKNVTHKWKSLTFLLNGTISFPLFSNISKILTFFIVLCIYEGFLDKIRFSFKRNKKSMWFDNIISSIIHNKLSDSRKCFEIIAYIHVMSGIISNEFAPKNQKQSIKFLL